jgi:hypothetical protein
MPIDIRCLVIAIEDYPSANGLSPKLAGTSSTAFDFIEWMLKVQNVTTDRIWLCASSNLSFAGVNRFGTERKDIRQALMSLTQSARNQTRQLYLFVSGHGFSFQSSLAADPADILICSDYADLATGGDACIGIAELQRLLGYWIGGEDHFYFVDCCRNSVDQTKISPGTLNLVLPNADDRPFIHTLYSTVSGAQAFTTSGFGKYLLEGLNAKGRAKGWTADNLRMEVRYELLKRYVKSKVVKQIVAGDPGDGEGLIFTLPTVPTNECTISVSNASSEDSFDAQLLLRGQAYGPPVKIRGPEGKVPAKPDVYNVQLTHPGAPVIQVRPPAPGPVDLYDPAEMQFELQPPEPPVPGPEALPPPPPTAELAIFVPGHTTIELTNLSTSKTEGSGGGFLQKNIDPGPYRMRVFENDVAIRERFFSVAPGESYTEHFKEFSSTPARASISKVIGQSLESGVIDFSETLGPTSNSDMGLWLSILGASKIINQPDVFSKLSRIPTATFDDIQPNSAAIFLLAAFESHAEPIRIGIHRGRRLEWHSAEELPAVPGVQQFKIPVDSPGPGLLSLAIGERPTLTFVIHTVPNRVTLITLSQEEHPEAVEADSPQELHHIRRYQYILPLLQLSQYVEPELRNLAQAHTDLRSIRAMFTIQQRFCADKAVLTSNFGSDVSILWQDAMYGKWLDPMMSVIMCYELIRRGRAVKDSDQIQIVANNLKKFFGLPDADAVLHMIGQADRIPRTPPLFVDGLLPFTERKGFLPFQASKIDFRSPWTTWRQVVSLNDSETTDNRELARRQEAASA